MGTSKIKTGKLEDIICSIRSEKDAENYIRKYTQKEVSSFSEYFNEYISTKDLKISQIIQKSNISRNYIYKIINGNRNPGRDKIIALCIAMGMNYSEINRALKISKQGVLYPKDERDARIIIAVNQGIDDVVELNIILEREGLSIIE